MVVGVLAAAAVGLTVWALPATAKPAKTAKPASAKVTTVLVTLGKPNEFAITLNKYSKLPAGKIMFKVTNKGVIDHDFKLCKAVFVAKVLGVTCAGPKTLTIKKGKTATLNVVVTKTGKYMFLCSLGGHAKNGMRGLLGINTAVTAKEMHGTLAGGTTTGPGGPPPPPVGNTCTAPTATTISVGMGNFFFTGVPGSIHCGTVTVNSNIVGTTDEGHNITFAAPGVPAGNVITTGSTSQTITLPPGSFPFQCDVGIHAGQGMAGSITVTN